MRSSKVRRHGDMAHDMGRLVSRCGRAPRADHADHDGDVRRLVFGAEAGAYRAGMQHRGGDAGASGNQNGLPGHEGDISHHSLPGSSKGIPGNGEGTIVTLQAAGEHCDHLPGRW